MAAEIIIAILGSGALSTVISALATRRSEKRGAEQAIEDGLCCLLISEIERRGEKYIDRGEIDPEDYQRFEQLYQSYKNLGGNGYAARIKEAVDDLPLK